MQKTAGPRSCHGRRVTNPPKPDANPGGRDEAPSGRRGQDRFESELLAQLPHLLNYALTLTRNSTEANELVQESVLKALEKRHQYEDGTFMRRWLFTILRNRYLDQWRRRTRRGTHVPVDDCPQATLSRPASQDDWMELRNCENKLSTLGSRDKSILLLSVFSPLSHREIADHLDVAEGTIRSRLSRARAHLRA